MSERPSYSAHQLAELLGLKSRPTPEQTAIIELPLVPRLVVAGAGSGKTATMVDRVVWLVANGHVRADEILGVTFTKKAAGELRERIRSRLELLRRKGLLQEDPEEGLADPVVSTYHSYANSLVKNYGLRLGIEQDAQMLSAAQSYQLVAQLVERLDPKLLGEDPPAKSSIISDVLALDGECAEHLVTPEMVLEFCESQIAFLEDLPKPGTVKNLRPMVGRLANKKLYAELVRRYRNLKKTMQVMDFGDLLTYAVQIAQSVELVGREERAKYRVVLLDEFQDTSHAQMQLFSALFGERSGVRGHPVMAVGDPKQSIYGFRGASDGQIFGFYDHFPAEDRSASYLTTAWRNDSSILDVANLVAGPLASPADYVRASTEVRVPDLVARPASGQGRVEVARFVTDGQEAQALAGQIARRRAAVLEAQAQGQKIAMPTMAVLTRSNTGKDLVRAACEEAGVPYQVVGLGGLLDTPEVVDTVAYLRVLADPGRSDALMRILSGARWRLGLADLLAFSDWAAHLETLRRAEIQTGISADDEVLFGSALPASQGASDPTQLRELALGREERQRQLRARMEEITKAAESDVSDRASLIEALETLPEEGWVSRRGRSLTPAALMRLRRLQAELDYLRQFMADDLVGLLTEIERTILLDIELAAKPGRNAHTARQNLDALHEVAAQFLLSAPRLAASLEATLEGEEAEEGAETARFSLSAGALSSSSALAFLSWLDAALTHEDGLKMNEEEPRPDAVQILTVHASKGLEWDEVYMPFLTEGSFPSEKDNRWTQSAASLPWPLRGDRAYLPTLNTGVEDRREFDDAFEIFKEEAQEHAVAEERRLAYVGMTRARSLLVLSASAWVKTRTKPAATSRFMTELFEIPEAKEEEDTPFKALGQPRTPLALTREVAPGELGEENPQSASIQVALWPFDPLDGPEISSWSSLEELEANPPQPVSAQKSPTTSRRLRLERAADNVYRGGLEHPQDSQAADAEALEQVEDWQKETELLLALLSQPVLASSFELPGHLTASDLVALASDPEQTVAQMHRPLPQRPGLAARQGHAFHSWVEEYYESPPALDLDFEGFYEDEEEDQDLNLGELQEKFKASDWAEKKPWEVEYPIETPLTFKVGKEVRRIPVRGRIDAVFREQDEDGLVRWVLVDWKTGRVPSSKEKPKKALQLALYRLAFARLMGVDPALVSGAFYYVATGKTLFFTAEELADEAALAKLVQTAQKTGQKQRGN